MPLSSVAPRWSISWKRLVRSISPYLHVILLREVLATESINVKLTDEQVQYISEPYVTQAIRGHE